MSRKNDKNQVVDYDDSFCKSNELSMAKLNQGLTLNQPLGRSLTMEKTQNTRIMK
ncbi:MAG TPA: hypothetical protein VK105_16225 [Virgibacillus sp.]|nr:hypothetical protein [Virgibacillus sp.]HLR68646.1 hypothetical protein [Virgibacillus sp.]